MVSSPIKCTNTSIKLYHPDITIAIKTYGPLWVLQTYFKIWHPALSQLWIRQYLFKYVKYVLNKYLIIRAYKNSPRLYLIRSREKIIIYNRYLITSHNKFFYHTKAEKKDKLTPNSHMFYKEIIMVNTYCIYVI